MRKVTPFTLAILVCAQTSLVFAESEPSAVPSPQSIPMVEKLSCAPCVCAPIEVQHKPARPPVYVTDWGRIVELTRTDPVVFPFAEASANRYEHTVWIGSTGIVVGIGFALIGTLGRATSDKWSTMDQWSVAGGISVAAISFLAAWAMSPSRDDLYTVINHWNLRHSDQPMAP